MARRHARRGAAVRRQLPKPHDGRYRHEAGRHFARFIRFPESIVPERFDDFRRELLAEIQSVPGIINAGTTSHTPLLGGSWTHGIRVGAIQEQRAVHVGEPWLFRDDGDSCSSRERFQSARYAISPRVAIVNETFVKQFAGGSRSDRPDIADRSRSPTIHRRCMKSSASFPTRSTTIFAASIGRWCLRPDTQHPSPGPGPAS